MILECGLRVSVESPTGAPNDCGVGDVLSEKGGGVWAVVGAFGLDLRAVRGNLLCVRRAHRDVEGSVGVAEGGGEDVDESEVTSSLAVQSQERAAACTTAVTSW